eukprot:9576954-Alexandrium_andersonii.AAC.1
MRCDARVTALHCSILAQCWLSGGACQLRTGRLTNWPVLSSTLASRRPFPAKRATRKALADARGGPQVWYSSKTAAKLYARCRLAAEERSLRVVL